MVDNIKRASALDLQTNILKERQTWRDLGDAISYVFETNIENPIEQLSKLRWIRRDTDPSILEHSARLLGFDLSQDVLSLNAENLTKVVTQLPHYPDHSNTVYFSNFVDMVLNAITEVKYLYTQDYNNFYDNPGGALVINNGSWFLSTHIELNIGLLYRESLLLSDGESLFTRIQDLFYSFAPVALVIEHFYFVVPIEDKDWVGGKAFGIGASLLDVDITIDLS